MCGRATQVRLTLDEHLDNWGASTPDDLQRGGLNVWRNSLPATGVPVAVSCDGVHLKSVSLTGNHPDNVSCDGQIVPVNPIGRYDWLYLLGCSERRSRAWFTFYFSNQSSWEQHFDISDLWEGAPAHSEQLAHRSSTVHYPHHVQNRLGLTLWVQRIAVPPRLPLTHVRLPFGRAVHAFDLVLVPSVRSDADSWKEC